MSERFGPTLLKRQLLESIEADIEWLTQESVGDSPIEKLFYAGLSSAIMFRRCEFEDLYLASSEEEESKWMEGERNITSLIVRPQAKFSEWRVDFLFHAYAWGVGRHRWRRLIVECDGHDYHERTKEQAAKDRSRDRLGLQKEVPVIRFTGSELWRDPFNCVQQFLDIAVSDWGRGR